MAGSSAPARTCSDPQNGHRILVPSATEPVVAPQFWQVKLVVCPEGRVSAVIVVLGESWRARHLFIATQSVAVDVCPRQVHVTCDRYSARWFLTPKGFRGRPAAP